jgi:hypothetical protein
VSVVLVAEERRTRFTEADFVVFTPHRLWYNLSSTDSSIREITVFFCITLYWNNCFLLYYVILKYLFSPVIRYSEITVFVCITLHCENSYFRITYYRWKQIFQNNVLQVKTDISE